ncbi:MAG TPA: pilin [Rhodocyclaceae bacterium]|nr:pilin [Rhodocyclaceae bacterium]
MAKQPGGFTMMEMMAVLAVIAILSTIAIPSFQSNIVRKQIEAAMPLADIAKKPIDAAWGATQTFPADNAAAGLPVADKIVSNYISAVSIQGGVINMTFGNRANAAIAGKILSLRPAIVTDAPIVPIAWVCGKAEGPDKMTIEGIDQTTVPDMFLPLDCRKLTR